MKITKPILGILGALLVIGGGTVMVLQHAALVKSREENQVLLSQLDRQADLAAENERMSNQLVRIKRTQAASNAQTEELQRLRAEAGRLRAAAGELAQLKAAGARNERDPAESTAKVWLGKVNLLRQRLEQAPEKQIPELKYLTQQNWFDATREANLESDNELRAAFSELRSAAKGRFAGMMSGALSAYVKANDGQLPTDVLQLKSYFDTPVDDATLQRYEMLQTGKLNEVRKGWLVAERAPVDAEFDTRYYISTSGTQGSDVRAYLRTNETPPQTQPAPDAGSLR